MARLYIVPVLFLWADAFNSLVLLCKQELAALIHRNTWNSNIVQKSNKLLNALKIFITNAGSILKWAV